MSEDFKDPNVIAGLIIAIILLISTLTILIIERF
tara:strand:+ start:753 stop:854 length:102 start_codon:yes stop_codon:yes gene_type:complete